MLAVSVLSGCDVLKSVDGDVLTPRALVPGDEGCTPRSEASGFPVKVLFVLENGGSMCIVDPPGAGAFCEAYAPAPPGLTEPARVRVVREFITASASRPNLFVATSWFDLVGHGTAFAPVLDGPPSELRTLQSTLGTAHDLQNGLADARARLEADLKATASAVRARTRYVVVLLATGTATPRCSVVDDLSSWATAAHPEGVWEDSAPELCNEPCTGAQCLVDFGAGGNRNQNDQLWSEAQRLLALKDTYGLGDLRLHTRQVLDEAALTRCGALCTDLYPVGAKELGRWTLGRLALAGQGTFEAPASLSELSVATVDTSEFTELCPLEQP
jgi:hypothetical protein